jgi:UDP:flavonoid glycosyltransferase YjiC (YdhE family)
VTRCRVLFFAEAVTLAHVARPVVLARMLDPARYEVHLARSPRFDGLFDELPFQLHPLKSVATDFFLRRLAEAKPVFAAETLRAYVDEDLALLERVDPDVIVGDFRLSLAVSAPLAEKPYLALLNAYWSPYARPRFPLPETPYNGVLGIRLTQALFRLFRPLIFAAHTLPLNRVRRAHGLASLGCNLRRLYAAADHVLYPDLPELIPTHGRPLNHHYIGPVLWSPPLPLPPWWEELRDDRPLIYVNLGSSGDSQLLPNVVAALTPLPATLVVATAGRVELRQVHPNVRVADYLPGSEICARAALVVCNGGSPTTQQALYAGVPVLGLPSNLDQYLNMHYLEQSGLGRTLRADTLDTRDLRATATALLDDGALHGRAKAMRARMENYPTRRIFESLLEQGRQDGEPGPDS